jgi:hypothetical protein
VRGYASRIIPDRPAAVHVQVTVTDFATRVDQSFLIMPGRTVMSVLTGYTATPGQVPRVFKVPVEIRAHLS